MKETLKISDRFNLNKKLGQGTFSYIYEAYDKVLKKNVALKIEKKDKNKSILMFEYNVLKILHGLGHVCSAYDFVKNSEQNLIVMDLLGNNLAKVRKCLEENYSYKIAIQLLMEMLDAIEEVHDRGFIHRDVKASNFVLSRDNKHVFIVDFGLAKKHLDDARNPVNQRKKADFRGTVSFASLNAHNNIDLSRRDDLWSLYFVILDFLNEKLKWREQKEYTMDEVKNIKTECLSNPEEKLWVATKDIVEVKHIFYHLKSLTYKDKPNYALIRDNLRSILNKNLDLPTSLNAPTNFSQLGAQRVMSGHMPIIIQQQPNIPVFTHYYNQKALAVNAPGANQEFQTPDKPITHAQRSQATAFLNPQDQTPQGNQSLGMIEDQAFPRASPHQMSNVDLGGFSARVRQDIMENRISSSNVIQISTQNKATDKKAHKPTVEKEKQPKRATKAAQNPKPPAKKRETKRQSKVTVVQDEEPMKFQDILQGAANELYNNNNQKLPGTATIQPQNQVGYYNFQPNNANCVNQQISISQNIFLSPHFLLLLNDKNENQMFQNQNQVLPPLSSQYSANSQLPTKASSTITVQSQINGYSDQQLLQPSQPMMMPINLNQTNQMFKDLQQQQPKLGQQQPLISMKDELKFQTPMISMSQQSHVSKTDTRKRRGQKNLYQYDPKKFEQSGTSLPIFKIERVARMNQQTAGTMGLSMNLHFSDLQHAPINQIPLLNL